MGQISLHAYVVMPEHVHMLVSLADDLKMENFLRTFKRRTSEKLNRLLGHSGAFWLPGGGYDVNINTRKQYLIKVAYVHENPEKRGLVGWEHSSIGAYLGAAYNGPEITFVGTDAKW